MKNIIFHYPVKLDEIYISASQIRPVKMINAFRNIGYEVDAVMGYGKERKEQIANIKRRIKSGKKYNFIYSESSTMPTLLTERHHLPLYPFLDFKFFKFCRKIGIPLVLFYRDVYWAFDIYKQEVSTLKRIIGIQFYKYDLYRYKSLINILYLPSLKMLGYIPFNYKGKVKALPPGLSETAISKNEIENNKKNDRINIFYVGGIGELYNLEKLFEAVKKRNYLFLTVCCRDVEWKSSLHIYQKYLLNERITIIHKRGNDLIKYYKEADILNLFIEPVEYRTFAMPLKLFEYLEHQKPIIADNKTSVGEFIKKNDVGWAVDYNTEKLLDLFDSIHRNKAQLSIKIKNIKKILQYHTWEARARQVEVDLV